MLLWSCFQWRRRQIATTAWGTWADSNVHMISDDPRRNCIKLSPDSVAYQSVSTRMCFPSLKKHQEKKIVCSRISSWKLLKKKTNWLNEVRKQRDEVCYFCRPFDPWGKGRHKKKLFFFFRKTPKFWDPPPLPAIRRPQFFLIRKFRNWRDPLPPPFGEKFRNILSFFMMKSLWIG